MKNQKKSLILIRITLWLLLFLWMAIIFMFSAESGTKSSSTSGNITQVVIDVIVPSFPSLDEATQTSIFNEISHIVRKSAHFFNFLILGLISCFLTATYTRKKISIIYPLIFCLLYAISDEVHQLFVPNRGGTIKDVLIDFSGATLGIYFASSLLYLFTKVYYIPRKPIRIILKR